MGKEKQLEDRTMFAETSVIKPKKEKKREREQERQIQNQLLSCRAIWFRMLPCQRQACALKKLALYSGTAAGFYSEAPLLIAPVNNIMQGNGKTTKSHTEHVTGT